MMYLRRGRSSARGSCAANVPAWDEDPICMLNTFNRNTNTTHHFISIFFFSHADIASSSLTGDCIFLHSPRDL
jgi:hypothetical protein